MDDLVISLIVTGSPSATGAQLQNLYRLIGRSTPELRDALANETPLYTASLFGREHIVEAPRLEKAIALATEAGWGFRLTEREGENGEDAEISLATLDEILTGPHDVE